MKIRWGKTRLALKSVYRSTLSRDTPQHRPALRFKIGTAAQPVPIDLGPIGAPTNFLFIDPIVFVTHSWTQSFIGWLSTFSLALPNDPALVGTTLYGQSAILEPPANPLGLILSHAVETRIGDQFEVLPMQQVDSSNPGSASGTVVDFGTAIQPEYGAVAIRLAGTFF